MGINSSHSKMDPDTLNKIVKEDAVIATHERLGILGVEQGQEPTKEQLSIVKWEQERFLVNVEEAKGEL